MRSPVYTAWRPEDAAAFIAVPSATDDKYTRGVLGVITGSTQYPGAAVIGVEAALRTGLGMVRYLGPERPSSLVLERRPEAVTGEGRVQAWLIGSGIATLDGSESADWMAQAVAQDVPFVLDGGALELCRTAAGPIVITPHFRELAGLTGDDVDEIAQDPAAAAVRAADSLGVTVLLKGHTTYVAGPGGQLLSVSLAPTWLATAGAGDALGGILGALVATHADEILKDASSLAPLAATASAVHGLAAERASAGGPLTVLDVAANVPAVIAELLGHRVPRNG
jgi:ADP-dependent NAD(P)H-hydrate dehydratase / NAD(P)H-hydrate epimerase